MTEKWITQAEYEARRARADVAAMRLEATRWLAGEGAPTQQMRERLGAYVNGLIGKAALVRQVAVAVHGERVNHLAAAVLHMEKHAFDTTKFDLAPVAVQMELLKMARDGLGEALDAVMEQATLGEPVTVARPMSEDSVAEQLAAMSPQAREEARRIAARILLTAEPKPAVERPKQVRERAARKLTFTREVDVASAERA